MAELPQQVMATELAIHLIRVLRQKHGPLMFHQSGGCCDGSSPMCYPRGEFLVGDSDVQLGEVDGEPFYMSRSQFEYWKHTQAERALAGLERLAEVAAILLKQRKRARD